MLTTLDIAWAAGIFEGEGSVQAHWQKSKGYRPPAFPAVTVDQKDWWLVLRLQKLFGGVTAQYGDGRYYRWTLRGPNALGFMLTIYQFLSPRRQEQFRCAYGKCRPEPY